jgi:hypothetical protein
MGKEKLFFVSIDTECDHSPSWTASVPLTFTNILSGIPRILQPLFNRYSVFPTYLLTVEVLENQDCVNTLKNLEGGFELGTHLHGELVEPLKTFQISDGNRPDDFSCYYEEDIEFQKIRRITALFNRKFSIQPKAFRAGRFGAGPSTLRSLEKLGYLVDTSVTPYIRWKNKQGVLDFKRAPLKPYYPDNKRDITSTGESNVLEVPVSIAKRLLSRPIWLRPYQSSVREMISVLDFLESKSGAERVFANMMFHSMEVVPKASPYPQTQVEVEQYVSDLGEVFEEAQRRGYKFMGLSKATEYV